jgi:hypothetical protein
MGGGGIERKKENKNAVQHKETGRKHAANKGRK